MAESGGLCMAITEGNDMTKHHKRSFHQMVLGRLKRSMQILAESGPSGIVAILRQKYGVPIPWGRKALWRANIKEEIDWWNLHFQKQLVPQGKAQPRLQADTPLQTRVVELLPPDRQTVRILDVGAGPLTHLGKKCPGRIVHITAVDPLAPYYDKILSRYAIDPPVRTMEAEGERLTEHFAANSFDLVYARNCIDHSYDPEKAVLKMIAVVKPGCFVLMEHRLHEAENHHHAGLHQWDFLMDDAGDFIIRSKAGEINMTQRHRLSCSIQCEMVDDEGPWIVTRMHKHQ